MFSDKRDNYFIFLFYKALWGRHCHIGQSIHNTLTGLCPPCVNEYEPRCKTSAWSHSIPLQYLKGSFLFMSNRYISDKYGYCGCIACAYFAFATSAVDIKGNVIFVFNCNILPFISGSKSKHRKSGLKLPVWLIASWSTLHLGQLAHWFIYMCEALESFPFSECSCSKECLQDIMLVFKTPVVANCSVNCPKYFSVF